MLNVHLYIEYTRIRLTSSGNNAYLAIVKCFVEICYFVDDATMLEKFPFNGGFYLSIKQKSKMNASLVTFVKELKERKFYVGIRDFLFVGVLEYGAHI